MIVAEQYISALTIFTNWALWGGNYYSDFFLFFAQKPLVGPGGDAADGVGGGGGPPPKNFEGN